MSKFDPYQVLGVPRAATPAGIKTAYRQRVQSAHPDRGGDHAAFVLLVRAFGLLSDPDARRLFDETGIVDDDAVKNYRLEVTRILADMFDAAVEAAVVTGLDLGSVNFIGQMAAAVDTGLKDARNALARSDREIASLQALRARIRRLDADRNLFVERLDAQIGLKAEQYSLVKRRLAMLETALLELGNYQSEVELIAALEAEN